MKDFIKRMMLFGIGLAAMAREKIEEFVNELVKKGEVSEKEGKEMVKELIDKSKKVRKDFEGKMEEVATETLKKLHIPTRRELDDLKERIEKLEKSK
jgi:polyhydroxyalkanoate synthesis regulator phasin